MNHADLINCKVNLTDLQTVGKPYHLVYLVVGNRLVAKYIDPGQVGLLLEADAINTVIQATSGIIRRQQQSNQVAGKKSDREKALAGLDYLIAKENSLGWSFLEPPKPEEVADFPSVQGTNQAMPAYKRALAFQERVSVLKTFLGTGITFDPFDQAAWELISDQVIRMSKAYVDLIKWYAAGRPLAMYENEADAFSKAGVLLHFKKMFSNPIQNVSKEVGPCNFLFAGVPGKGGLSITVKEAKAILSGRIPVREELLESSRTLIDTILSLTTSDLLAPQETRDDQAAALEIEEFSIALCQARFTDESYWRRLAFSSKLARQKVRTLPGRRLDSIQFAFYSAMALLTQSQRDEQHEAPNAAMFYLLEDFKSPEVVKDPVAKQLDAAVKAGAHFCPSLICTSLAVQNVLLANLDAGSVRLTSSQKRFNEVKEISKLFAEHGIESLKRMHSMLKDETTFAKKVSNLDATPAWSDVPQLAQEITQLEPFVADLDTFSQALDDGVFSINRRNSKLSLALACAMINGGTQAPAFAPQVDESTLKFIEEPSSRQVEVWRKSSRGQQFASASRTKRSDRVRFDAVSSLIDGKAIPVLRLMQDHLSLDQQYAVLEQLAGTPPEFQVGVATFVAGRVRFMFARDMYFAEESAEDDQESNWASESEYEGDLY